MRSLSALVRPQAKTTSGIKQSLNDETYLLFCEEEVLFCLACRCHRRQRIFYGFLLISPLLVKKSEILETVG